MAKLSAPKTVLSFDAASSLESVLASTLMILDDLQLRYVHNAYEPEAQVERHSWVVQVQATKNTWSRSARRAMARQAKSDSPKANLSNEPIVLQLDIRATSPAPSTSSLPSSSAIKETAEEGWLHGKLERTGEEGLFPDNYVEMIEAPPPRPQPAAPPQLPARTSIATPSTQAPALNSIASGKPVFSPKPALPARQSQVNPAPITAQDAHIDERLRRFGGKAGVALPGLGPIAPKQPFSVPETSRAVSGPPMLPKRSNTFNDDISSPASVKDRMATLTMATSSGSPPVQLPARPAGKDAQNTAPVRSPLSAAARPALPPRTLTDSVVDTPSSSGPTANKDAYHIQDSAAPAPKLTTFSRPRSARTAKSTSPVESKPSGFTSGNTMSTPPKLPSRNTVSTPSNADKPTDSGPVRFSPAPLRNNNGSENTAAAAALPAITRNSQPIPLPSRNIMNNSTNSSPSGFTRASESNGSVPQDGGSPFGVRLNNVGSKTTSTEPRPTTQTSQSALALSAAALTSSDVAPPLPARSNTFTSTPPMAASPNYRAGMPAQQRVYNIDRGLDAKVGSWDNAAPKQIHRIAHGLPKMELVSSEHCGMPPAARQRYEALFRSVCSSECIEGAKVHGIYVRSRLDSKTLAQIWDLIDIDNAGRLSKAQFCMGLYLIDERLASGTIPLEVSDELWVSAMQ
ncbi:Increased rDNA silencing protein [Podila clonocystis]|nr:Increased rDNA silencing protein [Podila clonocystis]